MDVNWTHVLVIGVVAFVNFGAFAWWVDRRDRRKQAEDERLREIEKKGGEHERRIKLLEERRIPGWPQIEDLRGRLGEIENTTGQTKVQVDAIGGNVEALGRRFESIEEWIRARADK